MVTGTLSLPAPYHPVDRAILLSFADNKIKLEKVLVGYNQGSSRGRPEVSIDIAGFYYITRMNRFVYNIRLNMTVLFAFVMPIQVLSVVVVDPNFSDR
ncbi:hypothetical protein EJB05_52721, partial [Eragrostis curvula]